MAVAQLVLPIVLSLMAFGVCSVPVSDTPIPPTLQIQAASETAFLDVPSTATCHAAVDYMTRLGVMAPSGKTPAPGAGDLLFEPEGKVDRAGAVTALYRLSMVEDPSAVQLVYLTAGGDLADSVARTARYLNCQYPPVLRGEVGEKLSYTGSFTDVTGEDSFAPGVTWAEEAGLLGKGTDDTFRPHDTLLRGELALFLYRYAQIQGISTQCSGDLSAYWDAGRISEVMTAPLSWAVESGVFDSLVSAELHPDYVVTRGQLAQTLTALRALCTGDPEATAIKQAQHEAAQSKSRENHAAIQAKVEEIAKAYGAQGGVQVAVIEGGRVTDSYAYGWADKGAGIEMTARHKMRIASISKVSIAMAAMKLSEEGRVDLNAPIGTYWGVTAVNRAYPNDPVSIRAIMSHTSSIPLYGDDTSRGYAAVKAKLAAGDFAGIKPGDIRAWGYNNYAFGVLGMTLELAEGQVMNDILDERFFNALDIDGAFAAGSLKNNEKLCVLYRHDGSVARTAEYQRSLVTNPTPAANGSAFAGGLVISAADMAKLVALLAGDGAYEGQRLLTVHSVEQMETPLGIPATLLYEQCYPIRRQHDIYGRDRLYYHTGSAYGVYNLMSYDPDTGDGVVVLTTGASAMQDEYGIYAICGKISQAVYDAIR